MVISITNLQIEMPVVLRLLTKRPAKIAKKYIFKGRNIKKIADVYVRW